MTNYEEIFGNIINNSVNMVDSETDFGLGITAIAGIMSLPDDLFDIISEQFIIELNNQIRSEEYHYGQYKKPYRSTEVFVDWIGNRLENSQSVCDLACGGLIYIIWLKSIRT